MVGGDVGGGLVPAALLAVGDVDGPPQGVAGEDALVAFAEHLGIDAARDGLADLRLGGLEVAQMDRISGRVPSKGLAVDVDVHDAGQGIGDH
jgi:hypothetical protein